MLRDVYSNELGIELPSYSESYEDTLDDVGIGGAFIKEVGGWDRVDDPKAFDAVWCRMVGVECHVGIYVVDDMMLHTMSGCDTCLVRINTTGWRRRVLRCYRHQTAS